MIKNKQNEAMLDIEVEMLEDEDGFPVADYDGAYFLLDVMNIAYGVIYAEVEEISVDGDEVNIDELHVKVLYDKTLTNVDKIMSCVRHAQEDIETFYDELARLDIHFDNDME